MTATCHYKILPLIPALKASWAFLATEFFSCKVVTVPQVHYNPKGLSVKTLRTVKETHSSIISYMSLFSYCSERSGPWGHLRSTVHALRGIHKKSRRSTYDSGFGLVDACVVGGYHHSVEAAVSLIRFLPQKTIFPIHCWSPLAITAFQLFGNRRV